MHLYWALQVTKRVAYYFFGHFSKPKNSQKSSGYLRQALITLYQVTPNASRGNSWPYSTTYYTSVEPFLPRLTTESAPWTWKEACGLRPATNN